MRKSTTIAKLPRTTAWLLSAVVTTSTVGGAWAQAAPAAPPTAAPAPAAPKPAPSPVAPAAPAAPAPAPAAPPSAAAPAAAPAQPDAATKKAWKAAVTAGENAYKKADYAASLAEFTKANELIPTIHSQYWIAMSLAQSGRNLEAYDALTAVLASPERDKLEGEQITTAEAKLDELKKIPGSVVLSTVPANATVAVDGQALPAAESPRTLELLPGAHKIAVSAEGFEPSELDVEVKPTAKVEQAVELTPLPPPPVAEAPPPPPEPAPVAPPAPEPPREARSRVPAYVTLGIAGASAIVGTIFGIKALSASSDFDDNPTQSNADDAERNALIADMAFGVTLTLGITGIVLLTSDEPTELSATAKPKAPRAKLEVAPYASPKSGGAAARLTF